MTLTKYTASTAIIAALADLPNATDGLSAAQFKAKFDENPEAFKTFVNSLIDQLESVTDGSSGADQIGATSITGLTGNTVQVLLEALKTLFDGYVIDQIPDGSLTDVKLSGDAADIKARFVAHEVDTTQDYTINLYVATTGDDANDGLSSGAPFLTVQKAFDTIKDNGYKLNMGTWKINLAAGTYNEQAQFSAGLKSKNRIQIIGAVDASNVPTVIFDGGSGVRIYGMQFSDHTFVSIKDVKFQNYTGNAHQGVYIQHFSNLYTINVHAFNCGFAGINAHVLSRLYVEGGIIDTCRIGVRIYSGSVATVGHNTGGLIAKGPVIKNCTEAGVKFYNQCSGHVDYTTLDNNNVGVDILNESRVHVLGSDIKNNDVGVQASINSTWNDEGNTYASNIIDRAHYSFSLELADQFKQSSLISKITVDEVVHTGSITETDLINNYTIPANTFITKGKKYRVRASGTFAGAGTKTVRVRIDTGNVLGFASASGSVKSWQIDVEIWAIDNSNQKAFGKWTEGNTAYNALYADTAFLMTSDRPLKLTGTLSDATGTITVETFEVEQVL